MANIQVIAEDGQTKSWIVQMLIIKIKVTDFIALRHGSGEIPDSWVGFDFAEWKTYREDMRSILKTVRGWEDNLGTLYDPDYLPFPTRPAVPKMLPNKPKEEYQIHSEEVATKGLTDPNPIESFHWTPKS